MTEVVAAKRPVGRPPSLGPKVAKLPRGRPPLAPEQRKKPMQVYLPQAVYAIVVQRAKAQKKGKATIAAQILMDSLMAHAQS